MWLVVYGVDVVYGYLYLVLCRLVAIFAAGCYL